MLDLAKEGCNVLFNYVSASSQEKGEQLIKQVEALGTGAKAYQVKADMWATNISCEGA